MLHRWFWMQVAWSSSTRRKHCWRRKTVCSTLSLTRVLIKRPYMPLHLVGRIIMSLSLILSVLFFATFMLSIRASDFTCGQWFLRTSALVYVFSHLILALSDWILCALKHHSIQR